MSKPKQTALDKRRAAYQKLLASLYVPPHTSIATPGALKQKPVYGRNGSV
jgi:hypothetical protein